MMRSIADFESDFAVKSSAGSASASRDATTRVSLSIGRGVWVARFRGDDGLNFWRVSSPVFFVRAPGSARRSPLQTRGGGLPRALARKRGGRRADWRSLPSSAHLLIEGVAPFGAPSGVFLAAPGRALPTEPVSSCLWLDLRGASRVNRSVRASGRPSRPAVSELLAGGRSAPGRSPGAARVQVCETCPRAPARSPRTAQPVRVPSGDRAMRNMVLE